MKAAALACTTLPSALTNVKTSVVAVILVPLLLERVSVIHVGKALIVLEVRVQSFTA